VAHALAFVYAPHEHAQYFRHLVLSMACPDFLTAADMKGIAGATCELYAASISKLEISLTIQERTYLLSAPIILNLAP
jgi:hypothetical protein